MKVVQTMNISKVYNNSLVINNVNINVEEGDIYGFAGENGAGKTTIIRMITGLSKPTSGTYQLFGVDYQDKNINEKKKLVSAIVESPSLYLNMTALSK